MAQEIVSTRHKRLVPIFNQGSLGSCTGNAAVGCLSTAPYKHKGKQSDAVAAYKLATTLDRIRGTYPPDDTGSSGLAVMKALKQMGWVEGYTHAFGLKNALRALVLRPGITGISWRTGCDNPDKDGVVRYSGSIRGGHEIELVGLDAEKKLVWFANSWGPTWGKQGYFAMSFDDYASALSDHGDATFPVP
jgi:C1A family cysteine protease